ncbi:hypothetical protein Patl1_09391 [Pistacia atlantica]|uniref:Uncharacterized protein n=1 Tax=Pistacia atlantica TaxID=434234 RepID=A0ACC1AK31_9ROSI|nr:hypothetical protein Patl1_09391 [Pistacia atlantica]
MEDSLFSPGTMLGGPLDSAMDLDYMNELFSEGCWVETIDGSEYPHPSPSFSTSFFDSSFPFPALETINGKTITSTSLSQQGNQEESQKPFLLGNSPMIELQGRTPLNTQSLSQSMVTVDGSRRDLENYINEGFETSRRWWIEPMANPGPATTVMERLIRAFGLINDFANHNDVLIQLWVPVNRANRRVLTTYEQPFQLGLNCQRLAKYRDISVNYIFSAEEDTKDVVGLPGRVFLGKAPEWTPDVQFFRSDEYPRVNHAQQHDVHGTLAVPVFELGNRTCLGVIEVVMTTRKIQYRSELENVCKALEAVDLRSSEVLSVQNIKANGISYQAALPEIQKVLRCACETHGLPLAQTWVPCIQQGKGGCWQSDGNIHCVSTVDHACHVADPDMKGFHEACSEHHLLKGQGVAGGAFLTNQPCFSTNITSFKKTDYPLSHHAKIFGLCGAVAIRLRSIHTGTADFVLEFFLPKGCRDPEEQMKMLSSLSIIIEQVCRILRVVTDKELEEETDSPISEVIVPSDDTLSREKMLKVDTPFRKVFSRKFILSSLKQEEDVSQKGSVEHCGDSNSGEGSFSSVAMSRAGEKRRTKAEKTITLQVLQKYFSGSLKDAAKSIGVCPTTLKRICRQHGIKRWPSRNIQKVGRSLQKLQLVIDSVQGGSGAFQIGSFYSNFPEFPKVAFAAPEAAKSPSYSQSSSSTHSCSSGTQKHISANSVAGYEDPMAGESSGNVVLKRVRSEAELHASNQGPKLLPRSQRHKSLTEQPILETLSSLPENCGQLFPRGSRAESKNHLRR